MDATGISNCVGLHRGMVSMLLICAVVLNILPSIVATYNRGAGEQAAAANKDINTSQENSILAQGKEVLEQFYLRYKATPQVDLVFVLDHSSSVSPKLWSSMLNFIADLLEHFTVDKDNTRVAIITYGTTASVDLNDLDPGVVTDAENKCTLSRRLWGEVALKSPHGYTATYRALQRAHELLLESRAAAKKAVLVLTDGKSNIGPPPVKMAFDILSLRWNLTWNETQFGPQVEIYAFGIDNAYVPELRSIASNLPGHVFMIPTFEMFAHFARSLHGDLQEETWIPTSRDACKNPCSSPYSLCMCGTKVGQYACLCQPGYEMNNLKCRACPRGTFKSASEQATCHRCPDNTTTIGEAAASQDECQPLPGFRTCPVLPDIEHGLKFQVSGTRRDEVFNTGVHCQSVTDGNSCHYQCDVGHRLTGSPVMVCNRSGQWEGSVPQCHVVDCHKLGQVAPGLQHTTLAYVNGTTFGGLVTAACEPGWTSLGHTTWVCDKDGRWSKPWNFQCAVVYCPPLPKASFLSVAPAVCGESKQLVGTTCSVTCANGFELDGPANRTCVYDTRPMWSPASTQSCRDIEAPSISCPDDIEVTVASYGANTTAIHELHSVVNDNSGNVTQEAIGRPQDNLYAIGYTIVKYTATDGAGNDANCSQTIHVKRKITEMRRCPSSVTLETNNSRRMRAVSWDEPVFTGPGNTSLDTTCTVRSGAEFAVGSSTVTCYPTSNPSSTCVFQVIITDPECPIPYQDRKPTRGSLICGTNDFYAPRVCRIHCQLGYKLPVEHNHVFKCDWDGSWNRNEPWPECARARGADNIYMKNEIHVRFSGKCEENKKDIREGFQSTITKILEANHGPCSEPFDCDVADIQVFCGSRSKRAAGDNGQGEWSRRHGRRALVAKDVKKRAKRDASESESLSILFTIRANFNADSDGEGAAAAASNSTGNELQRNLKDTLDLIYFNITDAIDEGTLTFLVNATEVSGERLEDVLMPTYNLSCVEGEISQIDMDTSQAECTLCPVGTFKDNNTCAACPYGTYQSEEGHTSCLPCPDATNTTYPGARGLSECNMRCAAGSVSPTGYEPCVRCPPGSYQPSPGQEACESCPGNASTSHSGNTDSTHCTEVISCAELNMSCIHGYCGILANASKLCICYEGFAGDQCAVLSDDVCLDNPCLNNGTCLPHGDNKTICQCTAGFQGELCEQVVTVVETCSTFLCEHGGTCVDLSEGSMCVCTEGYNGTRCDVEVDACQSDPCYHGSCTRLADTFGYTCTCDTGFAGTECNKAIDLCTAVTCENGGQCRSSPDESHCLCLPGYTGERCEKAVDFCTPSPCNTGVCFMAGTSYGCRCGSGFSGPHCERETSPDFDLVFRGDSVQDYVSAYVHTALHAVTACLWLRSFDHSNYGTILSYAVESNWLTADMSNAFALYDYSHLQVYVNDEWVRTNLSLSTGHWTHLCVTWDGSSGQWQCIVNGTSMAAGGQLAKNKHIEGGGLLVLGQEQDSIGGGFNSKESFVGEMSQLNIYDRVLSDQELLELGSALSACVAGDGNVLAWSSTIDGIHGNVIVRNQSRCLDYNECGVDGAGKCSEGEYCQDMIGSYTCLPCNDDAPVVQCPRDVTSACRPSSCQHGGACSRSDDLLGYSCRCLDGYIGQQCETEQGSCKDTVCQNGGTCRLTRYGTSCQCPAPWRGRFCHVMYQPSCAETRCLNNGTCVVGNDGRIRCLCLVDGNRYGAHCEFENGCDSSPCQNGGTCVFMSDDAFRCLCQDDYTGERCEQALQALTTGTSDEPHTPPVTAASATDTPSTTTTTSTKSDFCRNVNCAHGGTCVSEVAGFACGCTADYIGDYCDIARLTEVKKYKVTVTILTDYFPGMGNNIDFIETFRQQVHAVYGTVEGNIIVQINEIRKGSVIVDFDLLHTVYLDGLAMGKEAMKKTLYHELQQGRLGTFPASTDQFAFAEVGQDGESAKVVYILVALLISLCIVGVLSVLYVCHRRGRQWKPNKLNNEPRPIINNRIDNPAFQPDDSAPSTPRNRSLHDDNIYAELGDAPSPYATTGADSANELGTRFPSKRGKDINVEWAARQKIPLPPKPGEKESNQTTAAEIKKIDSDDYLLPCTGTPPPRYTDASPTRKSPQVDGGHGFSTTRDKTEMNPRDISSMYLTTLPRDGAASVRPYSLAKDCDYLHPREAVAKPEGEPSAAAQNANGAYTESDYLQLESSDIPSQPVVVEEPEYLPLQASPTDKDAPDDMMTSPVAAIAQPRTSIAAGNVRRSEVIYAIRSDDGDDIDVIAPDPHV